MRLTIMEYVPYPRDFHVCKDEFGKRHQVDMMVNGDFPEGTTPESLVGKTYECQYTHPNVEIAMGVNPRPVE